MPLKAAHFMPLGDDNFDNIIATRVALELKENTTRPYLLV